MIRVERIERFLSLAVGIAAITAVLVSLYQAQLARAQLRASAWPSLSQGNSMASDTPYRYVVSNEGIGPARIRSFRVLVDGKPQPTWNAAVRAMTGEGEPALVYSSFGRGSVLAPGAAKTLVTLPTGPRAIQYFIGAQKRLRTIACYCSVYDECWIADSDQDEPSPTNGCVADPVGEFKQ